MPKGREGDLGTLVEFPPKKWLYPLPPNKFRFKTKDLNETKQTKKYPEKKMRDYFFNLERIIAVINITSNMKAIKVN